MAVALLAPPLVAFWEEEGEEGGLAVGVREGVGWGEGGGPLPAATPVQPREVLMAATMGAKSAAFAASPPSVSARRILRLRASVSLFEGSRRYMNTVRVPL